MSTKFSQSYFFCKFVLSPTSSDELFNVMLDRFFSLVGSSRPVFNPVGRLQAFFQDFTPIFIFCVSFNRLARKRGYPDYFSADDLERIRNSEGQFVLSFME